MTVRVFLRTYEMGTPVEDEILKEECFANDEFRAVVLTPGDMHEYPCSLVLPRCSTVIESLITHAADTMSTTTKKRYIALA